MQGAVAPCGLSEKQFAGTVALLAAGLLSVNAAQASLIADGSGLVYDNVANVTWSSNGNLFRGLTRQASAQLSNPPLDQKQFIRQQ
ncbi:hypothetical protein [Ferrovum myxofaciens]|uniref:Uncharacterized protein n=1 Tax=Ferrovum myxofaciens TaxID=416213 RepID=A0A9E6MXT4_9PROT|nr:hypothetical protein [Ferrovum myxofaciens]QKE39029.1 MAG: hypothetical protein HO273_10075 [Ferrovum myxofaciens]QWY74258.1 MAG: hypothetical protein JVY19_10625 [Ferrovum myxofaciens]QWY77007.1 MAG: hypothetical protein JZL65_11065 [Ferrovum myxofaciens]